MAPTSVPRSGREKGSGLQRTGAGMTSTLDRLLTEAVSVHRPAAVFALFSGGHDSLCSTTIASRHPQFTAAVHINPGIGIEETRVFVRETCSRKGWP